MNKVMSLAYAVLLVSPATLFATTVITPAGNRAEQNWAAVLADAQQTARQLLDRAGLKGGLVLHLGCGTGRLTAALWSEGFLVHGLDADPNKITAARQYFQKLDLGGKVSAEHWTGQRLPYADNLANLIIISGGLSIETNELLRVLAPHGIALSDTPHSPFPASQLIKPWPKDIDEWTHYLHDAGNNAVAHDRVVASPCAMQWVDSPLWSRSHEYHSSLSAMVSAQGRLFAIFDEGPTGIVDPRIPDRWKLIARDAFSGVVLWKRDIADWGWRAWNPKLATIDWRRMGSQRTALPTGVARRLVAAGDRVYITLGYQAPLTALDAATGRTLMTYPGTERADEIAVQGGKLIVRIGDGSETLAPVDEDAPTAKATGKKKERAVTKTGKAGLMALDAITGRQLWETLPGSVAPLSLAFDGTNVFYHDQNAIICLNASSGQVRWRGPTAPVTGPMTLVAFGPVVLCASQREVVALNAADGKQLWTQPGVKGFGAANPPDLLVADGLVWHSEGKPEREDLTGYNLLTGQAGKTLEFGPLVTHGHHPRCYRSKATDNFLLLPKRGTEFVDLHGQEHSRNNWIRGACRYGMLPCNGLLYSTPSPCFCYAGVKLGGFLALSSQGQDVSQWIKDDARLERGPAFGSPLNPQPLALAEAWPMYRHDAKRSGSTVSPVSADARPVWKTQLGGKLTQPVSTGGRIFVARVDAGQVCCLNAASGARLWEYNTGGRVDSSPTCHDGNVLFGSADGWVYCLRATDGALVWRFHAAPAQRFITAFGQVESAWPVHGSVLFLNDTVYFAAGRSSFLDGGMILYGLDPVTGAKKHQIRLDGPAPDLKKLDENAYATEGAKSDLLVTDGTLIYLFHNAFNARLEPQPLPMLGAPGVRNLGERAFGEHLFSNAGFLDDSWFSRNHWMLGNQWTAFNFAHQAPKEGELLVFNDSHTYAIKAFLRRNMLSPLFFPATDGYLLVADQNTTQPVVVNPRQQTNYLHWLPQKGDLMKCWNLDVGFARAAPPQWQTKCPIRFRA